MRYYLILLLMFPGVVSAQTRVKGVLSGTDNNHSLTLAQLSRKTNGDTILVSSSTVDRNGLYTFDGITTGTYVLHFTSENHKQFYPRYLIIRTGPSLMTLDTVVFVFNKTHEMEGVTVTSSVRPLFEQHNEKLIFNVENSAVNVGSNALEGLQRIPGIFIDPGGGIMINGQSGPQIRLNGRLLNMGATERAELLRNIDISLIRKIEVSTLPNSTYDAAGTAGVINIVLKRNIKIGLNGSMTLTHRQSGGFSRTTPALSLNYLGGKWSFYGTLSYADRTTFDSINVTRNIQSVDTLIGQQTYNRYPYRSLGFTSGIIYKLTEKADLSLALNGSLSNGKTKGISNAFINAAKSPQLPANETEAFNNYRNKLNYSSVNLNYLYRWDTLGTEFSVNADYAVFDQHNNQTSLISEKNATNRNYQRIGDIGNRIEIRSADAQYFYHYDRSLILKGGVKFASSETGNQTNYFIEEHGSSQPESDKTSLFNYSEKILAGFFEVEKAYLRRSFIAGVRVENTNFDGITVLPKDTSVQYNRTDFFPFLLLSQKTFGSQNVTIAYSRRIERPGFHDLNPVIVYYDPYTYSKGNARLRPQFTSKIELAYNLTRMPVLKISYASTNNALTGITYQDDSTLTTYKTVDNLAKKEIWNFSVMIPVKIKNRFLSTNYFAYGITRFNGYYETSPISIQRNSFNFFNNTTYSFKNGINVELNGYYNRRMLYGLFDLGDIWSVNAGIQKFFFNNKLSVKLNATDIFRSQINRFTFRQANVDLDATQYQDTRSIGISFVYKFGIKSRNLRIQSSSVEAEKNRAKQTDR